MASSEWPMPPIKFIKQRVNATSRKLKAHWSIEASNDIKGQRVPTPWEIFNSPYSVETLGGDRVYGEYYRREIKYDFANDETVQYEFATIFDVLSGHFEIANPRFDIEKEIAEALSASIVEEIDKEILNSMIIPERILQSDKWINEINSKAKEIELIPSLIFPNEDWIKRSG